MDKQFSICVTQEIESVHTHTHIFFSKDFIYLRACTPKKGMGRVGEGERLRRIPDECRAHLG